jgi:CHAD domain-containing protein
MAKAAEVPLHPTMRFADAARATVGVRAAELLEHRAGVLDTGDVERVHALRVAARRLRAALEIFAPCFDPAEHKPLLREFGALSDALGQRRDPDVQLLALQDFGAAMPEPLWEGVELFAGRLREERAAANATLAAALRAADDADLAGRLVRLVAPEPA